MDKQPSNMCPHLASRRGREYQIANKANHAHARVSDSIPVAPRGDRLSCRSGGPLRDSGMAVAVLKPLRLGGFTCVLLSVVLPFHSGRAGGAG
jgi:hypothetical protein